MNTNDIAVEYRLAHWAGKLISKYEQLCAELYVQIFTDSQAVNDEPVKFILRAP